MKVNLGVETKRSCSGRAWSVTDQDREVKSAIKIATHIPLARRVK